MIGDFLHFVVEGEEGIARESARMGGEEGSRKDVAGDAARRENGQGDRERAFSHAGDIVDGKNAHKWHLLQEFDTNYTVFGRDCQQNGGAGSEIAKSTCRTLANQRIRGIMLTFAMVA